jgi:hypothetical protein
MNKLILVAALSAALTACGDAAEDDDQTAAVEAPAAPTPVAETSAGRWDVSAADGTKFISMLNADGTYQDTAADGSAMEKGAWEDRPDGRTCFDSEGEEDPVVCFTVGEAQADGTMIATPDDDSGPLTIKRMS